MSNRPKRKDSCERPIKSKEQLRSFYKRTWQDIYKHIEFPKGNLIYFNNFMSVMLFISIHYCRNAKGGARTIWNDQLW